MPEHFPDATKKVEFISREAAVEKLRSYKLGRDLMTSHNDMIDFAISVISAEVFAADVVEVVRCKDCKLMCHDEYGYWCINDYQACLDPEKDYCSRAARRDDND